MRQFKPVYGPKVDLDDPETYDYLPKTEKELDALMFREIGYALVYMDYFKDRRKFFPKRKNKSDMVRFCDIFTDKKYAKNTTLIDVNNAAYDQRQRVQKLIQSFADNRRNNHGNVLWYQEQIFLFQDEIENMC